MKKVYAATEFGRFFVTRPSDAAKMPSHFYCRVCQKNVSLLTHGHQELMRPFQGSRHFARDQRLRLETPGWRVLDFHGNPLSENGPERQREKIRKGPFVVRDREHLFPEDLISDGAGVVHLLLQVLTKMSCLVDALKIGGSYELIEKLWAQFVLTAGPVNTEVAWTRDQVLVGSVDFPNFVSFRSQIVVLLLVNQRNCNAAPNCAWLVGRKLTIFTALNSRSVVWHCGLSCGHGKRTLSFGLLSPLQTVLPLMPNTICQCLGRLWLLRVVRHPSLLFLIGRMSWPTLTANIWAVGTAAS